MLSIAHPPPAVPIGSPRRDPTAARAIGRTPSRPAPTAPSSVLRHRLVVAVRLDDGHGIRLLAAHLARAAG